MPALQSFSIQDVAKSRTITILVFYFDRKMQELQARYFF